MTTPSPFSLAGRVALVTGGNGGIGLAMAEAMARAGAAVMIAARNANKNEAALAALASAAGAPDRAAALVVDVAREADAERAIAATLARFGRLDILVNNAGIAARKLPQELAPADWQRVLDVNLTGAFLLSRAAYLHLKAGGHGKVINIGSIFSLFGAPYAAAYAAAKGGIVQLTKSLATAWAADNIQVNAVLPGWIDTELTRGARAQVAGLNERVLARTPAGRWGVPADLAGIAVFLASPASDFVTGTAIPVDGGYAASF